MKSVPALIYILLLHSNALKYPNDKRDILPWIKDCGISQCHYFPGLVFIPLSSESEGCAGGLISKRYILTHKHCLKNILAEDLESLTVHVPCDDDKPIQQIGVQKIITSATNDVAVLRLQADVDFKDGAQPLCLPFDNYKRAEVGACAITLALSNEKLYSFMYNIIANSNCSSEGIIVDGSDGGSMCLFKNKHWNRHSCFGDEGSPILSNVGDPWIFEGILTHTTDAVNNICEKDRPVSGFRITEEILQWIIDQIEE